uniref:Inhibitor I9 domain-containing protein n=2 Tax=Oryza TaxID=4527 RepID=Q7XDH6_ORYSJ|nr:hypothetical protein LOC_Os10g33330 [Oryza sativa Japonica Group]
MELIRVAKVGQPQDRQLGGGRRWAAARKAAAGAVGCERRQARLEARKPAFVEPPPLGHGDGEDDHRRWHESFLPLSELAGSDDEPRLVHSYTKVVSSFAARLTDGKLDVVSKKHPDRRMRASSITAAAVSTIPSYLRHRD